MFDLVISTIGIVGICLGLSILATIVVVSAVMLSGQIRQGSTDDES